MKYQSFLLISIKTVSIPELCPANGNMPTYVSNVCGIHKKGKKSDPSNYRPVSLTCIASKVLCRAML